MKQLSTKRNNRVGPQTDVSESDYGNAIHAGLAILSLIVGLQVATQYFAHAFNYQAQLGGNWNGLYLPWEIITWGAKWYERFPREFTVAGSLAIMPTGLALIGIVIHKHLRAHSAKANDYLHGSARWADKKDIVAAGLLPRTQTLLDKLLGKPAPDGAGVYVGAWKDKDGTIHYLRHNGPEHVLTYAPTRSGKGVGLVVPTMLSWTHSAVITDLKGELWALTAGWRQKYAGNKVIRFEPATLSGSARWNPLDEIRIGTEYEVGDAQNLATLIVDPDGKGLQDHWQKTSQALLVGMIIHVCYKAQNEGWTATIPKMDYMLSDPNRDVAELWMEMTQYSHMNGENHPVAGTAGRDMMDRPEEEAGSVLSTAKSFLALYRDPVVARNVSCSDFRIKDLMHQNDPVSLFIVTQPNDKARLRPLVRVMTNMIIRLLADKMDFEKGRPKAHYKHRLLMMLDEFPALGKLEILQESLAFVAGYGIKCYLICQDINQLKSRETGYGPDETITSNCHVQNAYPPNRIETAQHLSRLTGETTVVKEKVTTSGKRTGMFLTQVSKHMEEVKRPLLTDDECLRMPGPLKDASGGIKEAGDMVVYVAGYPAIYGKQPLYFQDETFMARAEVEAPSKSDVLRHVPAEDEEQAIKL